MKNAIILFTMFLFSPLLAFVQAGHRRVSLPYNLLFLWFQGIYFPWYCRLEAFTPFAMTPQISTYVSLKEGVHTVKKCVCNLIFKRICFYFFFFSLKSNLNHVWMLGSHGLKVFHIVIVLIFGAHRLCERYDFWNVCWFRALLHKTI